ncbi:MAG: hypothetical protein ACOXZ9_02600 [Bacteroidales bacterium]|jgi:hypothetical protein
MLNSLQYHLQKPWRNALKRPSKTLSFFNKYFGWFGALCRLALYILLTPIRLINAVYYNILVYGLWSFRDNFLDVFAPKIGGMRYKKGFKYAFFWIFGLPFRLIKYIWAGMLQFIESVIFVVVDTLVPTLSLYHGTDLGCSISISKPGKWLVGNGNYAGSGIYFTMNQRVAKHYAGSSGEPVLIKARVSLGRTKNLSLAPKHILNCVKYNGDKITEWCINNGYKSVEWWRRDEQWWEYCLVNNNRGSYIKTWRIRILYIYNLRTNKYERIWGGKKYWLF